MKTSMETSKRKTFAPLPRKGTETLITLPASMSSTYIQAFAPLPRKGTETRLIAIPEVISLTFAPLPRKGTETACIYTTRLFYLR